MTLSEVQGDKIKTDIVEHLMEQKEWNGALKELCNAACCNIQNPNEEWKIIVILNLIELLERGELQESLIEKVVRTIHNGREDTKSLELRDFQKITSDDFRIGLIHFINIFVNREISSEAESIDWANTINNYMHDCAAADDERIATNERTSSRRLDNFWQGIFSSSIIASTTDSVDCCLMETREHDEFSAATIPSSKEKTSDQNGTDSDDYVEKVAIASDFISDHIFKGATLLSDGLANIIVPNVSKGIEAIGDFAISQNKNPTIPAKRKQDHTTTATTTAKTKEEKDLEDLVSLTNESAKTSDSIRQGVRAVTYGIRDFSTRKIHTASKTWQEKQIGKQMIPDDQVRETLVGAAKVGVSTLGASALLVESMFHSTKAIAQTSVKVAAKVGAHYHGEEVGNLIDNVGVTAGNVLRTITHVGTLEAQVLSKAVARNTAKVEMKAKVKESKDTEISDDLEITEDEQHLRDLMKSAKEAITSYGEKIPMVVTEKLKSLELNYDGVSKDVVEGTAPRPISK